MDTLQIFKKPRAENATCTDCSSSSFLLGFLEKDQDPLCSAVFLKILPTAPCASSCCRRHCCKGISTPWHWSPTSTGQNGNHYKVAQLTALALTAGGRGTQLLTSLAWDIPNKEPRPRPAAVPSTRRGSLTAQVKSWARAKMGSLPQASFARKMFSVKCCNATELQGLSLENKTGSTSWQGLFLFCCLKTNPFLKNVIGSQNVKIKKHTKTLLIRTKRTQF